MNIFASVTTRFLRDGACLVLSVLLIASPAWGQPGTIDSNWSYYGADPANTKYSPLSQIDASNVQRLEVAWT